MTNNGPARPLMNAAGLHESLTGPGRFWREIRIVDETGSTNSDLVAGAGQGLAEGVVLVAEAQSAGRGRMGRQWLSPPHAGLTFSVLLRPAGVPQALRGWVPLLTGLALARALREQAKVDAWLKWPNDVQVNGAKLVGVLAEQAGDAIVVGAGVNVSTRRDELLQAEATSLVLEGAAVTDRSRLLVSMLDEIERWYLAWAGHKGDASRSGLSQEYQRLCATLGRQVEVSLPGGQTVSGLAREVDDVGRLVVGSGSDLVPVSAGDVIHVR
jgi:BirA family transcriptional regulator, biotin operon repressor / biotin---[acetyl-CoA-carboxylase] ligase